eukprot:TRINITY_DN4538_c0_g1_i2.p1 TRINITY_DN4538_c0_g1~~TRINITY_DN4538_c0_g1_i2.p1  ORF type:complete len:338 (-),score=72.12 TRINITY_DN4538_c0_g1_i2:29-1042(-)
MGAGYQLAPGECYSPYQPPDCTETVGDSLGWMFVVFQVCWALVWSLLLFAMVVGNIGRGFQQSSFVTFNATLVALIELISAHNPLGLKNDAYQTNKFLGFLAGCACGWTIFELAFLLMSILSMQSAHLPPLPTLRDRLTRTLPLSRSQQAVRIFAYLSLLALPFASLSTDTVGRQTLLTLIWAAFVILFILLFLVQVVSARRRLLRAEVMSSVRSRAISQAKKLFKILICFTVILLILCAVAVERYFARIASPERDAPRLPIKDRCDFACVLETSFFDILALVGVAIIFNFFVVPEPVRTESGLGTNGKTARQMTVSLAEGESIEMARSQSPSSGAV